jgi:hypothetical protein
LVSETTDSSAAQQDGGANPRLHHLLPPSLPSVGGGVLDSRRRLGGGGTSSGTDRLSCAVATGSSCGGKIPAKGLFRVLGRRVLQAAAGVGIRAWLLTLCWRKIPSRTSGLTGDAEEQGQRG